MRRFFETMYFTPQWYHYMVMALLLPFSLIYGLWMLLRRIVTAKQHFSIPIISVGNLQVGGSGKTPFVIALASRYDGVTIVSRGYGRQSIGLVEVSYQGKILVDVKRSGDEAMLMATSLPNASVIVCEDRIIGIENAMREGAKVIILDDGFNRVEIDKFELLLESKSIPNRLPFPAGGLRECYATRLLADLIVQEARDFKREVEIIDSKERMVLVTAISNPARLDEFLPEGVVAKYYYKDHAYFDKKILLDFLEKYQANSILCTSKDQVKMQDFNLPISEMKLELQINDEIFTTIDRYIQEKSN